MGYWVDKSDTPYVQRMKADEWKKEQTRKTRRERLTLAFAALAAIAAVAGVIVQLVLHQ